MKSEYSNKMQQTVEQKEARANLLSRKLNLELARRNLHGIQERNEKELEHIRARLSKFGHE